VRIVNHQTIYDPGDTFRLWGLGDLHVGAIDFDEETLRRHVKQIAADKHAYWIGLGDYGDLIGIDDKRFGRLPLPERYRDALLAEGGIPAETLAHLVELLEPIAGKCLGLVEGNHETALYKRTNISLLTQLATELRCQSKILGGYEGFVRWSFRRRSSGAAGGATIDIHVHHGARAGQRPGSHVNNAQIDKSYYPTARILMRGHSHQRIGQVYDALVPGSVHVRGDPWVYVCCGSYQLGRVDTKPTQPPHSTWEATRGFAPKVRMGPPVVELRPAIMNGRNPTEPPIDLTVTN
jgi:hypothetical protein